MKGEMPARRSIAHRGPVSVDVTDAWYFITICAEDRFDYGRARVDDAAAFPDGRACVDDAAAFPDGRAVSMKPPRWMQTPFMVHVDSILEAARFRHVNGSWKLSLFLVMPDHLHFIVHFPDIAAVSSKPPYHFGMEYVIADFKRWLSTKYGLRFQRDFWDTRLRDDAHNTDKFRYICNNPVRKGLCGSARKWPYVVAFNRETGEELDHR